MVMFEGSGPSCLQTSSQIPGVGGRVPTRSMESHHMGLCSASCLGWLRSVSKKLVVHVPIDPQEYVSDEIDRQILVLSSLTHLRGEGLQEHLVHMFLLIPLLGKWVEVGIRTVGPI